MNHSKNFSKAADKSLPNRELNRTAGYIRLLGSVFDEPPELVAIALRAELPLIAAFATERVEAA